MTRLAVPLLLLLLCLGAGGCGMGGLDEDQRTVLQTMAAGQSATFCIRPLLRGQVDDRPGRMELAGFEDLRAPAAQPDLRVRPGAQLGWVPVADRAECATALVPRVAGDRARVGFLLPGRLEEFGLVRAGAGWGVVARSTSDR